MEKKYVCKKSCFHRNKLWAPGETLVPLSSDEVIPPHFVKENDVAKVTIEMSGEEAETLFELQRDSGKMNQSHKIKLNKGEVKVVVKDEKKAVVKDDKKVEAVKKEEKEAPVAKAVDSETNEEGIFV